MKITQTTGKIFVANWKMYKSFNESIDWCVQHQKELEKLAQNCQLVICPDFTTLAPIKKLFNDRIYLGAQNCAAQSTGPYTGEVSVNSLVDTGCTHCIVGHSERRLYETPTTIAEKVILLLDKGISPIVCMGETAEEKSNGQTLTVLGKHLNNLAHALLQSKSFSIPIHIAYEPLWAIGTGKIPTLEKLHQVYTFMIRSKETFSSWSIKMLYGGSVTEKNIQELKKSPLIDGFLVGKSSLDFQELKKIVSLEIV